MKAPPSPSFPETVTPMTKLVAPALDPATVTPRTAVGYPPPFAAMITGRAKRALTKHLGLTQFGVNLTEIAPGGSSALRHWHTHEDEFIFVVEGEITLVTNAGEQTLVAGMCAGFPAGTPDGHNLINRSNAPAVVLEVGTRDHRDEAFYSDADLHCAPNRYDAPVVFTHRDGSPY